MLSIPRVFVAFHAAAYLALVGFTPASNIVFATPFPMPMMKNYSAPISNEASPRPKAMKTTSNHTSYLTPASRSFRPPFTSPVESRQDIVSALAIYVSDAGAHANSLQQCSASCLSDPQAQQQPSVSSLSLFSGSLLDFQHTVSDRGLAYFDKNSGLEVLIRKIIDETKYILNYTNNLVQCDPLLSELLGPTVYELKCIIEWLLDITEDATDASLNALAPLLRPLLGQFGDCALGLCLL